MSATYPSRRGLALQREIELASVMLVVAGALDVGFGALFTFFGIGLVAVLGLLLVALGVFSIVVAVALRRMRLWARTAALVLGVLGAVLSGASVVGLLLNGAVVWFLTRKEATRAFVESGR